MGTAQGAQSFKIMSFNVVKNEMDVFNLPTSLIPFEKLSGSTKTSDEPHTMHIHGVQYQIIARTGGRNLILPYERAWKDTVLIVPKEKVQIIMKFEQKGKFVLHCHNLEHEDDGIMLNFEVK